MEKKLYIYIERERDNIRNEKLFIIYEHEDTVTLEFHLPKQNLWTVNFNPII